MNWRINILAAIVVLAVGVLGAPAYAVIKASDKASNPGYAAEVDGAWKGLTPDGVTVPGDDNGGTGFLPWDFSGGYYQADVSAYGDLNHFIDGVDFTHSTFNDLGGPAFGLATAMDEFQFNTTSATRPFANAMVNGDVFTASIDTPSIYDDYTGFSYPFAIISFVDAFGVEVFAAEAGSSSVYGDFNWRFRDFVSNNSDIGGIAPTATSDGSSIRLEVTSATGGFFSVDGTQVPITFGNPGTAETGPVSGGPPAAVKFILYAAGSGDNMGNPTGQREFFFDDLQISNGPSIPGDFDGSDRVDGADLTQWKGDFGLNGDSDADGDMDSDGNDLLIWQRNLGQPLASPNLAAVPEPGGGVIAAVAAAAVVAGRGGMRFKLAPRVNR